MEILQTGGTLNIFGEEIEGYSNVYLIQRIDPCEDDSINVAAAVYAGGAVFTLTADGYHQITKLTMSTTYNATNYFIIGSTVYSPGGAAQFTGDSLYDLLGIIDFAAVGIIEESTDYFTYELTNTYYINLVRTKFLCNVCNNTCITDKDRIVLDTLLMGIEVIKLLMAQSQYDEAARIMNLLSTCTGITSTSCNCS